LGNNGISLEHGELALVPNEWEKVSKINSISIPERVGREGSPRGGEGDIQQSNSGKLL
jgi:hypothetical protein